MREREEGGGGGGGEGGGGRFCRRLGIRRDGNMFLADGISCN